MLSCAKHAFPFVKGQEFGKETMWWSGMVVAMCRGNRFEWSDDGDITPDVQMRIQTSQ
jgi:hypothetical protein